MSDLPQKVYVEYTRQELRRLQHWFQGFEAAGEKLPPAMQAFDCLHNAIRLFEHIQTAPDPAAQPKEINP